MQRLPSRGKASARPSTHSTKSFSRYEASSSISTPSRTRASTVQGIPIPDYAAITESPSTYKSNGDIFESEESGITLHDADGDDGPEESSTEIEELPDEIRELVDSFLESLGAKVHPTPLTIEQLSELFQDFYEHSQSRVDDHIAIEASRYPGQSVRTPSTTSSNSALSRGGGRRTLRTSIKGSVRLDTGDHQQMLTPAEVRNRRKMRKQLDHRRVVLEELVERSVCERVYSKLWRHRTTDDEERDEKLRSRAAALAVVGVSLKELLSTAMHDASDLDHSTGNEYESTDTREQLVDARLALEAMNQEKYPLGKLNHLKAGHKSIVETLQHLFPRSSSADEVLPTLIYTIITSSPDSNHIVSNFNYIQRFRNQSKIDGEAAYCLTNLEAAITFLETVDLSSIRANETPQGPVRSSSGPATPQTEKTDPLYHGIPTTPQIPSPEKLNVSSKPRSRASSNATTRPRGSSFLSQQRRPHDPTTPTEAVRQAADEALDAMHNALDNSFKFFFGKLKERQVNAEDVGNGKVLTPRTLEDAHKLVSAQPEDDDVIDEEETARPTSRDENNNALLRAIGGMRPRERERSVDSGVSGEGSRKVSVTGGSSPMGVPSRGISTPTASPHPLGSSPPIAAGTLSAVDKLTHLGNSLNPLRGWGAVGMMRGFGGRSVSVAGGSSMGSISSPVALPSEREPEKKSTNHKGSTQTDLSGIAPAIQRFLDCKDGKELNGYDVDLLLRDYQRLVGALRAVGVFET